MFPLWSGWCLACINPFSQSTSNSHSCILTVVSLVIVLTFCNYCLNFKLFIHHFQRLASVFFFLVYLSLGLMSCLYADLACFILKVMLVVNKELFVLLMNICQWKLICIWLMTELLFFLNPYICIRRPNGKFYCSTFLESSGTDIFLMVDIHFYKFHLNKLFFRQPHQKNIRQLQEFSVQKTHPEWVMW